jgi:hypothetical protein
MKVALYGDFRSPHAIGWRDGLYSAGIDVLAVSSEPVDDVTVIGPTGGVSAVRQQYVESRSGNEKTSFVQAAVGGAARIQFLHSLVQVSRARARRLDLGGAVDAFKPDIVHALRLPYEGVVALESAFDVPTVVSSWGQDFVPQASSDPLLRHWLKRYLPRAAGFQYDSPDDLDRALRLGLSADVPSLYAAGNFGVDENLFHDRDTKVVGRVVYARKATPNCNYFGFIEAALSLIRRTDATFVGIGLSRLESEVVRRYGDYDHSRLQLIGEMGMSDFAKTVREASVIVSPSYSDGMPITILGAVASRARIVAGDLPQLRELVEQGADITLVDATSALSIETGIEKQLRATGRAEAGLPDVFSRSENRRRVTEFYGDVLAGAV